MKSATTSITANDMTAALTAAGLNIHCPPASVSGSSEASLMASAAAVSSDSITAATLLAAAAARAAVSTASITRSSNISSADADPRKIHLRESDGHLPHDNDKNIEVNVEEVDSDSTKDSTLEKEKDENPGTKPGFAPPLKIDESDNNEYDDEDEAFTDGEVSAKSSPNASESNVSSLSSCPEKQRRKSRKNV